MMLDVTADNKSTQPFILYTQQSISHMFMLYHLYDTVTVYNSLNNMNRVYGKHITSTMYTLQVAYFNGIYCIPNNTQDIKTRQNWFSKVNLK